MITTDDRPYYLTTKSVVTVRCVDAYVNDWFKGTHCWETHGGSAVGLPVGAVPSPSYTPNGYPSSQGGGGNNGFNSGQTWQFVYKELHQFRGNVTGLNLLEKEKLANVIEMFTSNSVSSVHKKFFQLMKNQDVEISFTIGQTKNDAPAQYDRINNLITYRNADDINLRTTLEEFVHVLQDQFLYPNTMSSTAKNCEFEAKVFADIANLVGTMQGLSPSGLVGGMGQSSEFSESYATWIRYIVLDKGAYFDRAARAEFQEFCSKWVSDEESYSSSFNPMLLKMLFDRPIRFD